MKILKEFYDQEFEGQLQKYAGKPFKNLLKDINGKLAIDIDIVGGVDFYGAGGFNGRVNQIPWHLADLIIDEIHDGHNPNGRSFVDIKVKLKA